MESDDLFRRIRQIELSTRRLVTDIFAGGYHSVFKGRGIEFAQIREYVPGDDIRMIDWKATARLGRPQVKLFVEERELTVMLLVDGSASMAFGTTGQLKRQLAVDLCATLAFSAITNNDRVGLILFTDRVETIIPPKKGRRHILRLIHDLLQFEPERRGTDLPAALDRAGHLMRRSGTIFIVSDFLMDEAAAAAVEKPLARAAKRHDCVAAVIRDRLEAAVTPEEAEATFPSEGLYALEDPETGDVRVIDLGHAPTRHALVERRAALEERRRRLFHRAEVDEIRLTTSESFVEPLIAFFRRRTRHLRQGV